MAETKSSSSPRFSRAEYGVLWVLWLTYGSFYFCRTNISAALPGIEAEFGFSKAQIGLILGSLKLAYGIGQLVNGQLAEKISARKLLTIGMLTSALLNVLFGFGAAIYFLLFIWACNGYFQALGWTPSMRVTANWFPVEKRGRAIGIIGTGYQATAAITFVLAGYSVDFFGWRGAFYVPAILFALCCVHMLIFLKESPPPMSEAERAQEPPPGTQKTGSVWRNITLTLSNPWLWFLAVSLGLLNACRYGFLDWGLAHLLETQGGTIGKSGLKYAVLPLGGIAGAFLSGWVTDRWFGGRAAPAIVFLLVALGVLTLVYSKVVVAGGSVVFSLVLLVLIGFCIYGPQVLLVGTAPMDLARGGAAAAAVGFVNFMGYMGAFSGDYVTGHVVDAHGWAAGLKFWAGCAFAAALISACLWNRRTGESEPKKS
jgi:OPA family glycerol-3-phosphate transporter-like MFS transporter